MIHLSRAQHQFNLTGSGVIADIDTGVDPDHPVLKPVLLQGYDFTRNQAGGNEMNDLPAGTPVTEDPCVNCTPGKVNQRSIAMVDQRSIAMVDGPPYQAFGHGTMVAGILHLVAPQASLLPLKAFKADGTGNLSDIIRAVYFAAQNNANVVNMSFDLQSPSSELSKAITSAEAGRGLCRVLRERRQDRNGLSRQLCERNGRCVDQRREPALQLLQVRQPGRVDLGAR